LIRSLEGFHWSLSPWEARAQRDGEYQAHDGTPVVQQSEELVEDSYGKVAEVSNEAGQYYAEDSTEGLEDEQFTQMMFLDGCFILQFIFCLLRMTILTRKDE
jgi:hypothetical protein